MLAYNNTKYDIIVAFISSVIPENLSKEEILISNSEQNFKSTGLIKNSVIKLDKIMTMDKKLITGELGYLSSKNLFKSIKS